MKTQRGITLASLVIYVIALTVVVGVISVLVTFFNHNITNMNNTAEVNLELNKFEAQMIQETQISGNRIEKCDNNAKTLTFTSGNTYIFQDNKIYLNTIEITNNVESFDVRQEKDGDKQLLKISIHIKKGQIEVSKNLSYVM